MLRRKLASYTIMYIAGIAAGYFMLEKFRIAGACGLLVASATAVLFAGKGIKHELRIRLIMIAVMMCGFISLAFRYAMFESESSRYAGTETRVRVKVVFASVQDDRLRLIVKRAVGSEGPARMQITVNEYSTHPATDESGEKKYGEAYELTGTVIEAGGEYREVMPAENPGCFDNRRFLRGKGIAVSFKANGIDVIDEGDDSLTEFRRYLLRTREDFAGRFNEETSGFIRGVVFGDKRDIDPDTVKEFNTNSTGHILAVSGLHMGFLYSLLRVLSGRRKTICASLGIIAVMVIYGEMTMWSPATVRACIVMSISILSMHFRRPFDLLTAVSLAALLILIRQPYQLFDTGFEMSFLAMSGISFLSSPLSSVTGEALGVMIAVQLGTMPVTAYTFYRINPLAVFINLPVILLTSLLVSVCILMLMCGMITGIYPDAGIKLGELIAWSVIRINHIMAFDGGFSYMVAGMGAALTAGIYLVAFGMASEWTRVKLIRKEYGEILRLAAFLMMPLMMLSVCMYDTFADDEIVFVSVGQGDCTHIRAGGRNVLIDGGGSSDFNTGERTLMPYLMHEGADAVDIAIVTHLHMDHYKGICELAEAYPVGMVAVPEDYKGSAGGDEKEYAVPEKLTGYLGPFSRTDITDDVYIETVWPAKVSSSPVSADDPNEHNSVYILHYKGIKAMITGDLLECDESDMLKYYDGTKVLDCDILKVAHHGSKSSSSEAFLDAVSPAIAVIQVGRNNFYGHPHAQTLERLSERGIAIYRTDMNGAVGIDIKKDRLKVDTFRPERI